MKAQWNGQIETLGWIAKELEVEAASLIRWEMEAFKKSDPNGWPCDKIAHFNGRRGDRLNYRDDYFLPMGSLELLKAAGFPHRQPPKLKLLEQQNAMLMARIEDLEAKVG